MHVIQYSLRIYITLFLCLCAALLFAPKVKAAVSPTWDELWHDFETLKRDVNNSYNEMVNRSRGTTVSQTGSITGEVGSNNTFKASTPVKYSSSNMNANSSSVLRYGTDAVKRGAAACLKMPVRCNLAGAAIGIGIDSLLRSYDARIDGDSVVVMDLSPSNIQANKVTSFNYRESAGQFTCGTTPQSQAACLDPVPRNGDIVVYQTARVKMDCYSTIYRNSRYYYFVGVAAGSQSDCAYVTYPETDLTRYERPISNTEIDNLSENFELTDSDLPTIAPEIMKNKPATIELAPSEPVKISESTHFNPDGSSYTQEVLGNFEVKNSLTSNPSVEYVEQTIVSNYDSLGSPTGQQTSTVTDSAVTNVNQPSPPNSGASADIEIPPFCTWASIVCDWIGWTKEPLDELEPDLTVLISDFEPDEDGFDLGIGSGSCPAPIQLNIGIINKTVEVKYDLFCDFLAMIKPFVLAAAYLFAAYLYIGVLKRG